MKGAPLSCPLWSSPAVSGAIKNDLLPRAKMYIDPNSILVGSDEDEQCRKPRRQARIAGVEYVPVHDRVLRVHAWISVGRTNIGTAGNGVGSSRRGRPR